MLCGSLIRIASGDYASKKSRKIGLFTGFLGGHLPTSGLDLAAPNVRFPPNADISAVGHDNLEGSFQRQGVDDCAGRICDVQPDAKI